MLYLVVSHGTGKKDKIDKDNKQNFQSIARKVCSHDLDLQYGSTQQNLHRIRQKQESHEEKEVFNTAKTRDKMEKKIKVNNDNIEKTCVFGHTGSAVQNTFSVTQQVVELKV